MQHSQDFPTTLKGKLQARENFKVGDHVMGIHYPTSNVGDLGNLVEGRIEMISHYGFYNEPFTGRTWPRLIYLVGEDHYLTSEEILPFNKEVFEEAQFLFAQRWGLFQLSESLTNKLKTKMRVPISEPT